MGIIKDFKFNDDFGDKSDSLISDSGKVIKSARVNRAQPVVIGANETETNDDSFFDGDEQDSELSLFSDSNEYDSISDIEPSSEAPAENVSKIREELKAEFQTYFDDLLSAINGLKESRDLMLKESEPKLIDLSLQIAEKVVQKQVQMDPSIIKEVIEETFTKISGSDRITFKVNPNDIETFNEFKPYIESRLIGVEKISIQQDGTIEQGGAIIETDLGFVDVTIREKLKIIAQTFKKLQSS